MDVVGEINALAFVLNGILPLAVAALAMSTTIKIRRRRLAPLLLCLSLAALVGIIGCALAAYAGLESAFPAPSGLPRIWWRFAL